MIEWLGIDHLFELSGTEAIAGFLTPLAIFAVFFLAQIILPARRVPGYVINPETGEPRTYRLNGILVFAIALIVWATRGLLSGRARICLRQVAEKGGGMTVHKLDQAPVDVPSHAGAPVDEAGQ